MVKILLTLPEDLLVEVDEGAKRNIMCRTEYIRQILRQEVGDAYPDKIKRIELQDPARFADLDDS
jgi:metal-responsive CopG/Arc/MetJ family transcriptional regulator